MTSRTPELPADLESILRPRALAGGDPRALDAQIRRLLGLEPVVALRLGEVLGPLRKDGFQALGFVRFADYCREDLGLEDRTARNLVRLFQGLAERPAFRSAFLEGRIPEGHALLLTALPTDEDGEPWVVVAEASTHAELRAAIRAACPGAATRLGSAERMRVLEYDLPGDWFAHWLTGFELACRLHGRSAKPFEVIEAVAAEFLAGAPGDPSPSQPDDPGLEGRPNLPWTAPSTGAASLEPDFEKAAVPEEQLPGRPFPAPSGSRTRKVRRRPGAPADLPKLLQPGFHPAPRKAARLARRLVTLRQGLEVEAARLLNRMRSPARFRLLGHGTFAGYAESLGLSPSTAEAWANRGRRMERRPEVARALEEGRLSATQADLLEPILDGLNDGAWIDFASVHTCRRLQDVVEACRAMAAGQPLAWAARGHLPPSEGETLQDLRNQAALPRFEEAVEDLASALSGGGSPPDPSGPGLDGAQTFSSSRPASDTATSVPGTAVLPNAMEGTREGGHPDPTQTFSSLPEDLDPAQGSIGLSTPPNAGPPPTIHLRFQVPESVYQVVRRAEDVARRLAGMPLTSEECLVIFLKFFARGCPARDRRLDRKRREALERAGYRCEAPGCSSRCNLQVHHVVFRSHGGADEVENYCVTCAAHHQRHIHLGRMKVEGEDPETRVWEVGLDAGEPYRVFAGERLVDGWGLEEDPHGRLVDTWETEEDGADRVCEGEVEYRVAA